jgi:hypothetical protein
MENPVSFLVPSLIRWTPAPLDPCRTEDTRMDVRRTSCVATGLLQAASTTVWTLLGFPNDP